MQHALSKDWQKVCGDMRVAFGIKQPNSSVPVDTITATLQGIKTINVFGARIKHR
ncbi:MAG: hypothetical protein J5679_01915 [Alphaproteobacteria bacterium]|nr:hypothetical protein [Alphaproteobacteria bacterium]